MAYFPSQLLVVFMNGKVQYSCIWSWITVVTLSNNTYPKCPVIANATFEKSPSRYILVGTLSNSQTTSGSL